MLNNSAVQNYIKEHVELGNVKDTLEIIPCKESDAIPETYAAQGETNSCIMYDSSSSDYTVDDAEKAIDELLKYLKKVKAPVKLTSHEDNFYFLETNYTKILDWESTYTKSSEKKTKDNVEKTL